MKSYYLTTKLNCIHDSKKFAAQRSSQKEKNIQYNIVWVSNDEWHFGMVVMRRERRRAKLVSEIYHNYGQMLEVKANYCSFILSMIQLEI